MQLEQAQALLTEFFPNSVLDIRVSADRSWFTVCAKSKFWIKDAPAWSVSVGTALRHFQQIEVVVGGFAESSEIESNRFHLDDKDRVIRSFLRKLRRQIKSCAKSLTGEVSV